MENNNKHPQEIYWRVITDMQIEYGKFLCEIIKVPKVNWDKRKKY